MKHLSPLKPSIKNVFVPIFNNPLGGIFLKLQLTACMLVTTLGLCFLSPLQQPVQAKEKVKSTLTVKDSNQQPVTLPTNPKRVIVFDNGSLDTLSALGVGKKVIAVPTKSLPDYLAKFRKLPSAGGIKEPDLEKINQLHPDLIIISGRQSSYAKKLATLAPTLFLTVDPAKVLPSTEQNIRTLATIFNKQTLAKKKLTALRQTITNIKQRAQATHKTTLLTLLNEGQLSAFAAKSRYGLVFDTLGFTSADPTIQPSPHGQSISYEYIHDKNPDYLFVIDRTQAIGGTPTSKKVLANSLVKQTKAGKTGQVIQLKADTWYLSGGGLQSTQLMIEEVAAVLP
jgi:iron complex transport system substrate-binding protein